MLANQQAYGLIIFLGALLAFAAFHFWVLSKLKTSRLLKLVILFLYMMVGVHLVSSTAFVVLRVPW